MIFLLCNVQHFRINRCDAIHTDRTPAIRTYDAVRHTEIRYYYYYYCDLLWWWQMLAKEHCRNATKPCLDMCIISLSLICC